MVSGVVGAFSHVLLDSFLWGDMRPWAPWGEGNGMLGRITVGQMHLFCVGTGLVGVVIWGVRRLRRRGKDEGSGSE